MMKNSIKILSSMLIIFLVVIIQCQSFAANSNLTLTLESDKTQIKAGETVNILVKVSNIQGEGIIGFNANVNYNSDIFECTANGDDAGTWTKQGFIENNLTTTRTDLEASAENQTIAKLTFKAKADVAIGEQSISLSQIEFVTENESYNVADVATKIEIIQESTPGGDEKPGNDENPGSQNPGSQNPGETPGGDEKPGNTPSGGNGNTKPEINAGKNNVKPSTLPKTGVSNILLIAIVITALAAVVSLYQLKKYRKI